MRLSGAVPTNPPSLYRIRLWILDLPPSLRSSHRTIIAHQPGYRVPASIALKLHLGAKPPLEQLQGFYRHGRIPAVNFLHRGKGNSWIVSGLNNLSAQRLAKLQAKRPYSHEVFAYSKVQQYLESLICFETFKIPLIFIQKDRQHT